MSVRILSKQQVQRERRTGRLSGENGAPGPDFAVVTETVWVVRLVDRAGQVRDLEFAADPTDDDIDSRLGAQPIDLRPTDPASRLAGVANLAAAWVAVREAARLATTDSAFTDQERTRLAVAANLLRDKLRSLV